MATSGSVDFTVTRNELIETALKQAGVIGEGETPSAAQYSEGAVLLNMIVKARMSDGMPLWALKRGTVLPITGTSSINPTTEHAVTDYDFTTLSADAAAAAVSISVTSATGFTTGYNVGISLDSGTMYWTTVSGVSGTTISVPALPTAASAGNYVYVYPTANRVVRPLRVIAANIFNVSDNSNYPINVISREAYFTLGNRSSASTPNQVYYDPALTAPTLWVYPRFSYGYQVMEFTYHRPFEDFDSSTDTPDFPQEWYLALMFELASLFAGKYGIAFEERKMLAAEATKYIDLALSNGYPEGSIYLQPDFTGVDN
jgi:hypothetical protein